MEPLTIRILTAQLVDLEKTTQPQETILAIPRPKGNSYNLQKKMGLEDDTMKYDEIRVCPDSPQLSGSHRASRPSGRG